MYVVQDEATRPTSREFDLGFRTTWPRPSELIKVVVFTHSMPANEELVPLLPLAVEARAIIRTPPYRRCPNRERRQQAERDSQGRQRTEDTRHGLFPSTR